MFDGKAELIIIKCHAVVDYGVFDFLEFFVYRINVNLEFFYQKSCFFGIFHLIILLLDQEYLFCLWGGVLINEEASCRDIILKNQSFYQVFSNICGCIRIESFKILERFKIL